ncbi:methyltransferase RsmF C-terminal domain-like protein [Puia dinghuensis]|uniref:rRNA cytosine-C5-methyltransferase n=1 Tax=Puia dinghuensis TaxID=1792502 RepID=A0A8J2XU07_9BACT|nr:RNA methyltransferase [Puia dinghuensis]GGB21767.1 rRNA cytosine-C5-methyltransferase [Puia dinghuensis]
MPSQLPKEFLSSLEGLPGYETAAFEAVHAAGDTPTSIRINPAKPPVSLPDKATPVPWSSYGYYLQTRPSFTFDPLFHAGTYYVQEASSMFLEQALRQTIDLTQPHKVLDLCAAPGGKSTLLQSILSPDSLLVSNEVIRNRVTILQENMIKWGAANVVVTNNDPRDFQRLENYFDVIVVDAPCSGSGLFRREPEAVEEWSPGNVQLCWQRQQRILADCWPALRRDGILIYSTCSYAKEEDEDILDWITTELDATSCRLQPAPEWNIIETVGKSGAYGYRFYPHQVKGEGFFIACLRKNDGAGFSPPRKMSHPEHPNKKEQASLSEWIAASTPLAFFVHNEQVHAFPEPLLLELPILQSACYLKEAGLSLGQLSAKEFIPNHHLAMSTMVSPGVPALSLSREQALQYLRKEEMRAETTHRGWTLVQYEGRSLGWIKALPQRSNNYYPKEWRILKRE